MEQTKNKLQFFNRDTLKYFVCFFMAVSHFFAFSGLFDTDTGEQKLWVTVFEALGIIAPITFFFMMADGCYYTRSRKKYASRLLICAVISQIPDTIIFHEKNGWLSANTLFTLFFGILAVCAWESSLSKALRIVLVVLCSGITAVIQSSWMIFGVLYIFFLYVFREKPKKRFIAFTVLSVGMLLIDIIGYISMIGSDNTSQLITTIINFASKYAAYFLVTKCCNGKKGKFPKFSKWFFYVFYPTHILVIGIIYVIVK